VRARTPYRKGSPCIVCPLLSSAALLIRNFTAECLVKGNLDILEGMVGQKHKERSKWLNGREKSKEHEMSQIGRPSLTYVLEFASLYQLNTQVHIFHKILNHC